MLTETIYCDCCSEDVPYNRIVRDQTVELTCQYCGYVLQLGSKSVPVRADCILIGDDSQSIRELLKGAILNMRLAKEVSLFEDGAEFIKGFIDRATTGKTVDLVILDLEMPKMDGFMVARLLRFIEDQKQLEHTPILFFTSKAIDDPLREQLREFLPASYLNKSSEGDPQKMADRITQVVINQLKKSKEKNRSS